MFYTVYFATFTLNRKRSKSLSFSSQLILVKTIAEPGSKKRTKYEIRTKLEDSTSCKRDPVELHVGSKEIWSAKMKNSKDFWKVEQTADVVFITIYRLARSAFLR